MYSTCWRSPYLVETKDCRQQRGEACQGFPTPPPCSLRRKQLAHTRNGPIKQGRLAPQPFRAASYHYVAATHSWLTRESPIKQGACTPNPLAASCGPSTHDNSWHTQDGPIKQGACTPNHLAASWLPSAQRGGAPTGGSQIKSNAAQITHWGRKRAWSDKARGARTPPTTHTRLAPAGRSHIRLGSKKQCGNNSTVTRLSLNRSQ